MFWKKSLFCPSSSLPASLRIHFFTIKLLRNIKTRESKQKEVFIDTFIKGVSDNTIANSTDLLNIYFGITKFSPENLTNRQDLNKWLRETLARLINKEVGQDLAQNEIIEIKKKLQISSKKTKPPILIQTYRTQSEI